MDRGQYLMVMAACVLATLPLEFVFGARVYRRPRRLVRALAGPFVLFWVVDALAVARHLWDYAPRFVTGWQVPVDVPAEELVFFVVVPLCALLTFEAAANVEAGRVPPRLARLVGDRGGRRWVLALVLVGAALGAAVLLWWRTRLHIPTGGPYPSSGVDTHRGRVPEYTLLAPALVLVAVAVEWWWRTGLLRTAAYRATMLICLAFMIPVNGWLTKLSDPIVRYERSEFSGWRPIWDIPAEDYLFGTALLTLVLLCWVHAGRREPARAASP